ncbi:hypothetical protein EON63_00995 [archaeon]|nr:MAG: hypothetical protein EON63_00995 [archaeon]
MDGSWKSFQDESFIPEEDWKDSLALSSYLKMRRSRASPGAPERHNDLSPIAGFGTPFASMPRANLSILTSPLHRLERDERDSSPSAPLSTRTTMRDNEEEDVLADTSAADSFFLKLLLRKAIREKDVLREEVASLQRIREIHVKESQQKVEDTVKLRAENRKMRLAAGCAILRGMLRGLYVRCMSKVMGRWRTHIYQQHTHHTHTLRREFVLSKARAAIQKQRRGVMCVSLGRWVRYIHHIHSMEDMMVTKGVCKTQYVYVRKFIITLKKMYAMKRMCRVMLKGVMRRVWMCMRRYGTYRLLSVCNMYKGVCMVYRYTLTQHALRHVIGVWKEDIHCHKRQSIVCRRLASMVQRHTYTYIIHRAWCVWKTYIRQTDKVHTLMKGVCRSWYKRLVAHGMDMLRRNVHVHKCMGHHIHKLVYVHRQYQVRSAYKKWNVYVNSVKRKHMVLQRVLCMMDMYRGRMPNYFYWWRGLVCARGLQQHIQAITTTHTQELANMAHILHHTHQHIYQCGGTRLLKSTRNIIMRKVFQHWCMVQTTTSKHSHHRQQSLLRTVKILYHRLLCRGMSRWKRCCRVWRVMGMMVASLEICGLRHGMVRWKTHTRHVSKLQQKLARIFGILKRQKLKSCHQHWRERSWYLSRCRNHMYNLLAHLSHYHVRWCMHQWKIGIITKTLTIPYTMSLTKYTKLSLKHVMVCWKRYVGMARGVRGGIGRVLKCLTNHHIHRAYTTWKYHTRSTCKLSRMVRLLYHHRYQHLARGWGRWVWYVMGMVRGMCIQHQVQNQLHKQHIQSMQHHIHVTEIMVENLGGHMVHTHANRLKYKVFSMWRVYVHTQRRMLKSVMRMLHHNLHHSLHRAWAIWKHHAIHQTHSLQSKMDLQNLQSKYAFEVSVDTYTHTHITHT